MGKFSVSLCFRGHMTTLKQSCAVNYPKGIFKNTEIPSTEPILKLIYCHKDKKTDKLRFFEKVAAIFIQHMTCKRTRTALNAAGVGNRQQIITASLTSQYQSLVDSIVCKSPSMA